MNIISINKQIALNWIDAFNDQDIDKLLALYSDDAVHYSPKLKLNQPETGGWISGKEQLRNWWAGAFLRLPSLRYKLQNLVFDDNIIFLEYRRTVNGEEHMLVAEVLEINNALICRSKVYHS